MSKWKVVIEGVWDDEGHADMAWSGTPCGDLARAFIGAETKAPTKVTYASMKTLDEADAKDER